MSNFDLYDDEYLSRDEELPEIKTFKIEDIIINIKLPNQQTIKIKIINNATIRELKEKLIKEINYIIQRNEETPRSNDIDHDNLLDSQDDEINTSVLRNATRNSNFQSTVNSQSTSLRNERNESPYGETYKNLTINMIRFIFSGKVLDNDDKILSDYKLESNHAILCLIGERNQLDYNSLLQNADIRRNSHDGEGSEIVPRGFDQLRDAGLREEDIQEMRTQFYGARPDVLRRLQNREITLREVHEMEEEWMQETNADVSRSTQNDHRIIYEFEEIGNNFEMFIGIILGYIFGLFMTIWILDGSLSFKFKYGVLVGLCSNFLLTLAGFFFG